MEGKPRESDSRRGGLLLLNCQGDKREELNPAWRENSHKSERNAQRIS